jgi:hypothetical protein
VTVQQGAHGTSKQGQQQDQTSNCRPGELNLTTGCSLALEPGSGSGGNNRKKVTYLYGIHQLLHQPVEVEEDAAE